MKGEKEIWGGIAMWDTRARVLDLPKTPEQSGLTKRPKEELGLKV